MTIDPALVARVRSAAEQGFAAPSMVLKILDALEAGARRRCSNGHEQDRLWSACYVCQLQGKVDEVQGVLRAIFAALYGRLKCSTTADVMPAIDKLENERDAALAEVQRLRAALVEGVYTRIERFPELNEAVVIHYGPSNHQASRPCVVCAALDDARRGEGT